MDCATIDLPEAREIENDTYTITFCDPKRMRDGHKKLIKDNMTNKEMSFFFKKLTLTQVNLLVEEMLKTKKKIIKIEITGHAENAVSTMVCEPLSRELLAYILSIFPFDKKILLVKNMTCYGNRLLPADNNFIPQQLGKEERNVYDVANINGDILDMCQNTLTSIQKGCCYYGGNDSGDSLREDVTFIDRRIHDPVKNHLWYSPHKLEEDHLNKERPFYCRRLYQDLQDIRNIQQQNNNQYYVGNNQYQTLLPNNFPSPPPPQYQQGFPPNFMPNANNLSSQQPYYQQMPYSNNNITFNKANNYTNPVSLQSPQYQQNPYSMQPNNNISPNNTANTDNRNVGGLTSQTTQQQYQNDSNTHNININSVATNSDGGNPTEKNNGNVFCDLKSGICCGCKWW